MAYPKVLGIESIRCPIILCHKLGKEDGKTGGGGYGSIECSVSMSNKSCSDYVKGYNDGYSSTCGKNPDGCNNILSAISPDPF